MPAARLAPWLSRTACPVPAVDATFLRRSQRSAFHALAVELGVPFALVSVTATPAELRARVAARAARGSDAADATLPVLEAQMKNSALTIEEARHAVMAVSGSAETERALCEELALRLH